MTLAVTIHQAGSTHNLSRSAVKSGCELGNDKALGPASALSPLNIEPCSLVVFPRLAYNPRRSPIYLTFPSLKRRKTWNVKRELSQYQNTNRSITVSLVRFLSRKPAALFHKRSAEGEDGVMAGQ